MSYGSFFYIYNYMIKLSEYAVLLHPTLNEAFDNVFDFLLNPEHDNTEWYDLIRKFETHGGKVLGQGKHATVMEHPSWKYVLKVFSQDAPYLKFVRFVLKNPRKSFPVFYDKPRKIVPRFKRDPSQAYLYVVKTEKLNRITKDTFKDIEFYLYYDHKFLDDMIEKYRDRDGYEDMWHEMKNKLINLEKQYPSLPQFKSDYNFLLNQSYENVRFGELDMHYRNIMQRSNGDFVLIDPFWQGESLHQMQTRVIDQEIDPSYLSTPSQSMLKGGQLPKKVKSPKLTKSDDSDFNKQSYGDDFPIFETKLDKKEYEKRYDFVTKYIDNLINNAPGNNRAEKLDYVWKHHADQMNKLRSGLKGLSHASIWGRSDKEPEQSYKSKFTADKYYIRFGDFPTGGKSKNWATGEMERGVSAYPVKWNVAKNKWEIDESQLEEFEALYSLTYDVASGNGRPIYLVYGQETNHLGSDGEPLLNVNNVKIVKKLEPYEFFSREIGEEWYNQEYL